MASEPAKVVGLTTGALIDAQFEKPRQCQWNTNTQIHPQSELSFYTAFR